MSSNNTFSARELAQYRSRLLSGSVALLVTILISVIAFVFQQAAGRDGRLDNHERRLATQETKAYTAIEASRLAIDVTRLEATVGQHRRDLDRLERVCGELLVEIRELRSEMHGN